MLIRPYFKTFCSDVRRNSYAYGLFAITAATLVLSCFVPIHIDDIMADIFSARFGFDGGRNNGVWVLCAHNFDTPIPFSLMPGKALAWLIAYPVSTPVAIRLFGVASFIGWMALLTVMAVKSFPGNRWQWVLSLVIGLTFLGVMPFLPVFVRPETLISVVVTWYALLPFYIRNTKPHHRGRMVLALFFLLTASWLFALHPKALFFAPLAVYSLFMLLQRPLQRTWSIILLLVIIAQATRFWVYRLDCSESGAIQAHIEHMSLPVGQLFSQPGPWLSRFVLDVLISPTYIQNIVFLRKYPLGWLPDNPGNPFMYPANIILTFLCLFILFLWFVAMLYGLYHALVKRNFLTPDFIVPWLILVGFAATAGIEKKELFYDTTLLWLGGCCLSVILVLRSSAALPRNIRQGVTVALAGTSFLSQLLLLYTFHGLPAMSQQSDPNGVIAKNREFSVLDYAQHAQRIRSAASHCNINAADSNPHLALDGLTYLPFRNAYQPVYIDPTFIEDMPHRLLPFLKENHSAGLIAECRTLPQNLQQLSHRENGLCCIDKSIIDTASP